MSTFWTYCLCNLLISSKEVHFLSWLQKALLWCIALRGSFSEGVGLLSDSKVVGREEKIGFLCIVGL